MIKGVAFTQHLKILKEFETRDIKFAYYLVELKTIILTKILQVK